MNAVHRWVWRAGLAVLALCCVRLAWVKSFSIDEFQYAHAAWLMSKGQLPYVDFFEVHFPFLYQLLSLVSRMAADDPEQILAMRLAMLMPLGASAVSVAMLNRDRSEGAGSSVLASALLLTTLPFVALATEVRPDALAAAFFLSALAVLRTSWGARTRAVTAGALLTLCVWSSQKALFYAAIFPIALVGEWLFRKARRRVGMKSVLADPPGFVIGAVLAALPIAVWLLGTGSMGPFWKWCIEWAAQHQRHYPSFEAARYLQPVLEEYFWLFALAALGVATTVRRRLLEANGDALLLAALPSTFLSYALQRAPYPYSLLPFLAVVTVFAARGALAVVSASNGRSWRRVAEGALIVLVAVQGAKLWRRGVDSNQTQREVLARIGQLTSPEDAAYDNSGGYVSRPHGYFYFYTDAYLRDAIASTLVEEVPRALIDRGCVLRVEDVRSDTLPEKLRAFLSAHYHPMDGDLSFWGQRYQVPDTQLLEGRFLAVKAGRYFLHADETLDQAGLRVDGNEVEASKPFFLEAGNHTFQYRGPGRTMHLLWLPRDGRRWAPRRDLPPTFSRLF